jgi:hypothetical protein
MWRIRRRDFRANYQRQTNILRRNVCPDHARHAVAIRYRQRMVFQLGCLTHQLIRVRRALEK